MGPDPSLSESFGWSFWFLGEVAFRWLPGAAAAIIGQGIDADGVPSPITQPITQPISAPEVAQYLQMASVPEAYQRLFHEWSSFVALSLLISLCLAALVIYNSVRVFQIRQIERRKWRAAQQTVTAHDIPRTQLRWNRINEEANSEMEQNRRLAILEADIMLNELLDTLGYRGETMADKMRSVDPANFKTISYAWEAHRVRNRIAHEADAHLLSAREVRRVIGLYEKVFKEFKFIG